MIVPTLPDSAPFTPEQRAWLNGFFAGVFGAQVEAVANQTVPVVNRQTSIQPEAPVEEHPWHDPALPLEHRLSLAEGKPVHLRLMASMAQLDCGACGYLCDTYSKAIADGTERDLTRCAPGGKPTADKVRAIVRESRNASSATCSAPRPAPPAPAHARQVDPTPAPAGFNRERPYAAALVESKPLNKPGSEKDTRHVVFELGDSGLSYEPGDALGLYPENCNELVDAILKQFSSNGSELVPLPSGEKAPLRKALTSYYGIGQVDQDVLDLFARCAVDPEQRKTLLELSENGADGLDLLDTLEKFPTIRPDAADLVATLKALRPRLYSISSSPRAHPGQVHLTVGYVSYMLSGRLRKGVASTYLADRLLPGAKGRIFIQPSHRFGPPTDPTAPMIMVGPGTGIAPFRSFLEDREASGATGKNWLFFGDQRKQLDFLYQSQLELYLSQGLLTRLDTAFSRDQKEKVYVQNKMLENGAELWKWLQQGAYFYVCGDAKRMALDVDNALQQIVAKHGEMSAADAKKYVVELGNAKRYQKDVY